MQHLGVYISVFAAAVALALTFAGTLAIHSGAVICILLAALGLLVFPRTKGTAESMPKSEAILGLNVSQRRILNYVFLLGGMLVLFALLASNRQDIIALTVGIVLIVLSELVSPDTPKDIPLFKRKPAEATEVPVEVPVDEETNKPS